MIPRDPADSPFLAVDEIGHPAIGVVPKEMVRIRSNGEMRHDGRVIGQSGGIGQLLAGRGRDGMVGGWGDGAWVCARFTFHRVDCRILCGA